jgi:hypothetical protein
MTITILTCIEWTEKQDEDHDNDDESRYEDQNQTKIINQKNLEEIQIRTMETQSGPNQN